MKIVVWSDLFLPYLGGVEVISGQLDRALRERGHEVMHITNALRDVPRSRLWKGCEMRSFPFRSTLQANDLKGMRALCTEARGVIAEFAPDVAHAHLGGPSTFYQVYSGTLDSYPSIATVHGTHMETGLFGGLTAVLLERVRRIACVSDFVAKDVREHLPKLAHKVMTIRNALPAPTNTTPMPDSGAELLCVGRLSPEKAFDTAIEAMALLSPAAENARLTVIGNGPEKQRLMRLADSCGVRDRVRFADGVPPEEVPRHIDASSMVVMPSRWNEAFGLVALEALQRGRHVVTTGTGGIFEIQGPDAPRIPINDPPALAAEISRLLADRDELRRLADRGRIRAATHFNFESMVDSYEAVFREVAVM